VKFQDEEKIFYLNLRSRFNFEACIGEAYRSPTNTFEVVTFIYSIINGNGITISMDELVEYCDKNESFINDFFNGIVVPEVKEVEDKKKVKKQVK
jgi:uncharacterized membrane protein